MRYHDTLSVRPLPWYHYALSRGRPLVWLVRVCERGARLDQDAFTAGQDSVRWSGRVWRAELGGPVVLPELPWARHALYLSLARNVVRLCECPLNGVGVLRLNVIPPTRRIL